MRSHRRGTLAHSPLSFYPCKSRRRHAPLSGPRVPAFQTVSWPLGHFSLPVSSVSGRYPGSVDSTSQRCPLCATMARAARLPVRVRTCCLRLPFVGCPIVPGSIVEVMASDAAKVSVGAWGERLSLGGSRVGESYVTTSPASTLLGPLTKPGGWTVGSKKRVCVRGLPGLLPGQI